MVSKVKIDSKVKIVSKVKIISKVQILSKVSENHFKSGVELSRVGVLRSQYRDIRPNTAVHGTNKTTLNRTTH